MSYPSPTRSPTPFPSPPRIIHRLIYGPPTPKPPTDTAHVFALIRSYAPDYALTILLFFIFGLIAHRPGFKQQFSTLDPSIQHTYAQHERVPMWAAVLIAAVFPFTCFLFIGGVWLRSLYDLHAATLGLLLTLSLTTVLTDLCKLTVGRPRPDLLARCLLPPDTSDAGFPYYGLVSASLCTQTNQHILNDGFKSFFSGHSSFSFAGLGFLSFYLAGKVGLWDRKGHAIKPWICGAPLVVAALVAISRVMDYRHHWQDIVVGSLVGWLMSWFVYRLYYPPLTSPHASKPYAPRVPPSALSEHHTILPLHVYSLVSNPTLPSNPNPARDPELDQDTVPEGIVPREERWGRGTPKYTAIPTEQDVWREEEGRGQPQGSRV
ncbi:PAP2-domain-containing protein [Dacryopinax primogenitus]|uniref:PAP2-domain-containing protein n=1 Tax=Dacryopinax primogenitus (strain DJM 731) TaxID=1858805 RepID=M5FZH8_DACPD|nr:PAP2-domain-containing protein [Dacryopinax primogenitus]EJT98971.1 PAP2-domain-containing protein [Dacryopinax primogenitus]